MSSQSSSTELIRPSLLSRWIAERPHIWQMNFLDERKLATFAEERGISFRSEYIRQLWQLGLLQVDLLISDEKINTPELNYVGTDEWGRFLYAYEYHPDQRLEGWGNAIEGLESFPTGIKLQFHPFRYYVLYHLDRVFKLRIHPMQMLSQKHFPNLLESQMTRFQQWTSKPEFLDRVQYWNRVATLAIATEPYTYAYIFGSLKYPDDLETQQKRIEDHWADVSQFLSTSVN